MLRFLPYIVVSILVYMGLIYMQTYQPEEMDQLIMKIDVFGITNLSKYEHWRLDKIKRLETYRDCDGKERSLGSLEKQVLINHTVFICATAEMVEYALGPPKLSFKGNTNNLDMLYYVYFIANDKRPTVFEFVCTTGTPDCKAPDLHKDIFALKRAYKKSTIDLEHLDVQGN